MKSNHNGQNFKVLLGLTLVVFLVHMALLNTAPLSIGLSAPPPAKPFVTRTLVASSSGAAPQTAAKPSSLSPPGPRAAVRPRPAKDQSKDAAPSTPAPAITAPASAPPESVAAAPVLPESAPAAPEQAVAPEPVAEVTAAPRAERARQRAGPSGTGAGSPVGVCEAAAGAPRSSAQRARLPGASKRTW